MTRRYDYNPPPQFFLQIYTIHVNDLFQGENGKFRWKMTSLHPCGSRRTDHRPCSPRSPLDRVFVGVLQDRQGDSLWWRHHPLAVLARGQPSSSRGPPRHHRTKMEGGDPPVSGEFPALSQSQPAIVRSSHMPATVRGSFTPAVRSPRKPAAVRGSSSHTAVRGQSRPAGSEYGKTACSEFGKPAGHSSFQASASASTGLSRARSSSAPSRACSSTAPSRSRSSTTPSSASPSIALSCACASSAPCSSSPSSVLGCARASQASALPECLCFQSAPKCPRPQKSAPPERPQESMPPEWPRCLIDPLFSPRNFFWGVVGLQPLRLGPQPLRQSRHGLQSSLIRHGLPSPRIHHGRPNSLLRHGHPSPRIRHGCPSSPLRHGSRNGRCPGGLLSCLRVRPPERPPPLPVGWCPTPFGRVE